MSCAFVHRSWGRWYGPPRTPPPARDELRRVAHTFLTIP
jgi:hypothetical protein